MGGGPRGRSEIRLAKGWGVGCLLSLLLTTRVLPCQVISGAKDLVYSKMTKTKDAISSGVATMVDTAKGVVQGGLGVTRSAFTGTKEAVASGVTGAVGVAKGAEQYSFL